MPIKTMPIKMIVLSLVVLIAIAGAVAAVPLGGGSGGQSENNSLLDRDYDDSWVTDFPDTVDGHNVRYINTPKDRACISEPVVYLQTPRASLDEYLSNPPDISSLKAAIQAVPGVPTGVTLSFSPGPIDREAAAAEDAIWNKPGFPRSNQLSWI